MNKKRLCPTCQTNYISGWKAKECNSCHRKNPEFIARMREQSHRANKKANEVRWGAKQANDWYYSVMSPELAYIIGAYITDGWVNLKRHTLGLDVTSESFSDYFTDCLKLIGLSPGNAIRTKHGANHKGKLPAYRTHVYSRTLCIWLKQNTDDKKRIPQQIFNAPIECQIAFLSGTIDGDGMVSNEGGNIAVYGSSHWMIQLPSLLTQMNIRTGGYRFIKTLPSGKNYYAVSIHRQDFIDKQGFSAVSYKHDNLITRPPKKDRAKRDTCPNCGKQKLVKSKTCHRCYVTSSEHQNRLRDISASGHAARWQK